MITDPSNPLYSISLKLDRAAEQFNSLRTDIASFLKDNPYTIEIQVDPQAEHVLGVVRVQKTHPIVWSAIIGEIAHNLRCALDYLVFQLVTLETGTEPPTDTKIQFPIFKTEPGFNSRGVPEMLKGVGKQAQALIKSLQPFATGEGVHSPLWQLRELSNWDKHRSISLAMASTHSVAAQMQAGSDGGSLLIFPRGIFQDNTPLFGRVVPPGPEPFLERASKVQVDGHAIVNIVFKNPVAVHGLNVGITLKTIGDKVFDACKRIHEGIFPR